MAVSLQKLRQHEASQGLHQSVRQRRAVSGACLADGEYDWQPAHIHMLGVGRVVIQLQFRLLIRILSGANLHQRDARVLQSGLSSN